MFKKIRNSIKKKIITGIAVLLPIGLTAWIIWSIFKLIGERFLPLFINIPSLAELPLVARMFISAAATLFVIWVIGLFARNFIGKLIIRGIENLALRTPVVSKIYKIIRQITETMFMNKQAFKKAALIEYPREGIYTMVFVVTEMIAIDGSSLTTVFVPSTPNPTTGFCMILPTVDVNVLPISINQAMEFVFSGGILVPENFQFPVIGKRKKFKFPSVGKRKE